MRVLPFVLALAFAAGSLAPAAAEACEPTTSVAHVDTGPTEPVVGARYYFAWDCYFLFCQTDNMGSPWLYQESNGIDGWQRGDEVVDDTCRGLIEPDTLIF